MGTQSPDGGNELQPVALSRSAFGGVTQQFAPDEQNGVTRFYELRNATEQLGNLVGAHGSVSAAQDGSNYPPTSVYFPMSLDQSAQALGDDFRAYCVYQFGAYVIVGGQNASTPAGYSLAWCDVSPPDLSSAWTRQTPQLGAVTLSGIRCLGMFGGNLYASGVAGSADDVRVLQLDLTVFPVAPCWNIVTPAIVSGVAGARATTLVPFSDVLVAGTSAGVRYTTDPVAGIWQTAFGIPANETFYVLARPGSDTLFAVGQTAIYTSTDGRAWSVLRSSDGVPLSFSSNTGAPDDTRASFGMHAAIWYVDSLVWLKNASLPSVVRYSPPNVPDGAPLDVAPVVTSVPASSLCAYRNDLYASWYDVSPNVVLLRRAYSATFASSADFVDETVATTALGTAYAMLAGPDCLYAFSTRAATSSNIQIARLQPYTPTAIASLQDNTNRVVTLCYDAVGQSMRAIRLNTAGTAYAEIANFPSAPATAPKSATAYFLGVQFYSSAQFETWQEVGGVFSPTAVAAATVAQINSVVPDYALGYVPRGRYCVVHGGRLWVVNLSEDANEAVMAAAQKPLGVRACVPRGVAYFNVPALYDPATLWLTNDYAAIETAQDRELTGAFSYRGSLYVTSNNAVWFVNQTQAGSPLGISLVTNNYGCTSHNSIVNAVNLMWWWSEVGPVVFDGQSIRVCRGSVRARQIINALQLGTDERALMGYGDVHARYYAQARQVLFWVNAAGLPWQNTVVAIDVDTEELSLYYPQSDGNASERGLSATCSGVLEGPDDSSIVYAAGPNGALYQVSRAPSNDTHPIDFFVRVQAIGAKTPGLRYRPESFSVRTRVNDCPVPYGYVMYPVMNGQPSQQRIVAANTVQELGPGNGTVRDGDYIAKIYPVPETGSLGTDAAWQMRIRSNQPVEVAAMSEIWIPSVDAGNLGGRGGG